MRMRMEASQGEREAMMEAMMEALPEEAWEVGGNLVYHLLHGNVIEQRLRGKHELKSI